MESGNALFIWLIRHSCCGFADANALTSRDHNRAATMLARGVLVACLSVILGLLAALSAAKLHDDASAREESRGRERAELVPLVPAEALDFGRRWAATQIEPQTSHLEGSNWSPAGGLATLLFNVEPQENDVANHLMGREASLLEPDLRPSLNAPTPLPIASPRPRARGVGTGSVVTQTTVAGKSGAPFGGLEFLFRFFEAKPHTADQLLASHSKTAVYDISTHTVYMPDGKQLEAHSGFGEFLDDPSSVDRRDLGPTPPNIYQLSLRPALFHGVQALRMIPAGDGKMFGRNGFLAHPYMLGEDGASNGCLSLQNYEAFLQAYEGGEVKQIIVLARLDAQPAKLARADQISR
jgi:hypothetical protein